MNRQEADILRALLEHPYTTQRELAGRTGHSLGIVNRALKSLREQGFLDEAFCPTEFARGLGEGISPKRAVILAAGFGMRMVPINLKGPKAMLEVNGEPLIERQIRQLQEVGITEIRVVVGFMKERFEYLMDRCGVELVVNPAYAERNNLHSLALCADHLANCYIVPCDLWCRENPFRRRELYSWYMVRSDGQSESDVRVNRKQELVAAADGRGNAMVGIAYLTSAEGNALGRRLRALDAAGGHEDDFWEAALYREGKLSLFARVVPSDAVAEINTYEQLRELDDHSRQLRSGAMETIARVFGVPAQAITDITVLKKGMTNRSFRFTVQGARYIMRIPGEGTDQLIDRRAEARVYDAIAGTGLCDEPVYLNPDNGFKITRFLDGVRTCDPESEDDLRRCMEMLRQFHGMRLTVEHTFDIFGQIEFYEHLWQGEPSVYRDYAETKARVLNLRPFIEAHRRDWSLTHIDAVPDNFLFHRDGEGERLQLTDWEYAGMQDPHVDVAMFCIYSLYDRTRVDRLIDLYFEGECTPADRIKLYCYIAACGLLWSNWCEYKSKLGAEFGEYSLRQYRYAKEYALLAMAGMKELEETAHDTCG